MGAYFYQTDHLGSTTMLTDGYGNPIAGPGQSGTSYMSYYPYREINYTESSGPDIFRYKFTGQIADSETGLYYYKSRYYDPFLGRFIQADDRADQGINGLNRYMYVGGNPVNRIDPDGHSWLSDRLKVKGFFHRAFFVSGDRAYAIGGTFGRKIAEAGSFVRKFATNPTFRNGVLEGMLDFTAGSIDALLNGKPMPYVTYHHGGYMIGNSYITDHRLLGYGKKHIPYESNGIAHVGHGTSLAVRKHESGHIDQDLNMGLASQHGYAKEISNDLTHGTINYNSSVYWFYKLIGPDATRNLAAANAWAYGGEVNYDSAVHSFNMGLYFNNVSNFDPISNWSTFMEAIKRDIWSGFQ